MNFEKLLHDLNIPQPLLDALLSEASALGAYDAQICALSRPETAEKAHEALDRLLEGDSVRMLACHLSAAALVYNSYREKGIPEEIYYATMGCFSRFLGETVKRTGKLEFDRAFWTWRQASGLLYRVGELEFELLPSLPGISLHIPSDSRITPENVSASLKAGREFMTRYFPETAAWPMGCESWLLSPELGKLLKQDSNILAFQRRFRILKTEDHEDCLEWLFAAAEDTPYADLPERTSLQRSVKAHLLSGGKIGGALGVLEE